jgi:Fe-S-cluster containining protein
MANVDLPASDAELRRTVDAALTDAARRAGDWLLCRAGCTQCCYGAFAISPLDALRLRVGMEALRSVAPEAAAAIEDRARAWIAAHGQDFPGDLATGLLGESEQEAERFEEFANEAACPALDPASGRCALYAWRPMTCRVFGPPVRVGDGSALAHCELCFVGASSAEVAACEMSLPHELEQRLLDELGGTGDTVVAFALLTQL